METDSIQSRPSSRDNLNFPSLENQRWYVDTESDNYLRVPQDHSGFYASLRRDNSPNNGLGSYLARIWNDTGDAPQIALTLAAVPAMVKALKCQRDAKESRLHGNLSDEGHKIADRWRSTAEECLADIPTNERFPGWVIAYLPELASILTDRALLALEVGS